MPHDHSPAPAGHANETRLAVAAGLTGVFMLAEFAGGIISGSLALIAASSHILLEGAPADIDIEAVVADLAGSIDGIEEIHHVHAWSITQERQMVTLHARIADRISGGDAIRAIKARLHDRHGIDHATVEIERG